MSVTVSGVPPYVTRTQVLHAVSSLGLDPADVADLEFRHDAIYVTVYATDEEGNRFADARGLDDGTFNSRPSEAAAHRLAIPILNKEPT